MGVLINNLELKKYKLRIMLSWVTLGISLFFLMGNFYMISTLSKDRNGILDAEIVANSFSMTYLDRGLMFLVLIIIIGLLFKDKEEEIRQAIINGEEGRKKYFINKVLVISLAILVPLVINILIKMICYFSYSDIFAFKGLILSIFYFLIIGLFFTTVVFLMNLIVKDKFLAGILPVLFADGLIILFAVSKLLISDRLEFVRNILGSLWTNILGIFSLLTLDFKEETFSFGRQVLLLLIVLAITLLLGYISYFLIKLMERKNLNRPYFFELPRYIIYIFMSILISFCLVSAVGYFAIMIIPNVSYIDGTFYVNIASVIFAITLFMLLESVYRVRVLRKEYDDYENKEVVESKEIQVCNEANLEFDLNTGFLEINDAVEEKTILENDNLEEEKVFSENKNKSLEEVSNFKSEDEKIIDDEFNKRLKDFEFEEIDHGKDSDEEVFIDDTDEILKNFVDSELKEDFTKQ